ncbi:hypothetical protein SO802_025803 [Lithocarpus litseifolius]|uniref:Uncharacterized protein n=1 Tax=Lithocarpus litseifolius TaxID=425828 RepID=A0AAW2BYR8_9ROSI
MFGRSRFLSFPLVIGAVIIGVVSGKAIFGPPLEEYWKKRLQEEAAAKETDVQQVHHESPGGHDALMVVESEGFPVKRPIIATKQTSIMDSCLFPLSNNETSSNDCPMNKEFLYIPYHINMYAPNFPDVLIS